MTGSGLRAVALGLCALAGATLASPTRAASGPSMALWLTTPVNCVIELEACCRLDAVCSVR